MWWFLLWLMNLVLSIPLSSVCVCVCVCTRVCVLKGAVEVSLRSIWFTAQSACKRGAHAFSFTLILCVCWRRKGRANSQYVFIAFITQSRSTSLSFCCIDMTYIKEFLLDGKKVVLIYQQTCKCMSFNVNSRVIDNRWKKNQIPSIVTDYESNMIHD